MAGNLREAHNLCGVGLLIICYAIQLLICIIHKCYAPQPSRSRLRYCIASAK